VELVQSILKGEFESEVLEFFSVSGASTESIIGQIEKMVPDIIFCDLQMKGMDGYEMCRQVRKKKLTSSILLMSEFDSTTDQSLKTREAGGDGFLIKPLQKGDLLFSVHYALRVGSLSDSILTKSRLLENSYQELKSLHGKMADMDEELQEDKERLGEHIKDMMRLNSQLEAKNSQISLMNQELAKRFDSTVGLLANIIELHQSDHRGHSERVAEIARFIATKMELSESHIQNVYTAARLHELGIVSLPRNENVDEVVNEVKSRKYTNHPLVGEMLLKGFPGFEMTADIIRHMHENVDGSGNPDGLVGDRIPVGSRIVSAASYYDHARLANMDKQPSEVLKIVEAEAGTLFDENVVSWLGTYLETQNDKSQEKAVECSVFALEEGMELFSDIYSESGINLLRKGTIINKDILGKILKFNNVDPIVGNIKVKQN
jgi:response regulator RpfG family c-di-GMP phosphodiesterase